MVSLDLIPATQASARDLPSDVLYALERAGEISRAILDERVTDWATAGWTQRRMADELGCSQQAVSERVRRLGIAKPRRPRNNKALVIPAESPNGPIDVGDIEDVTVFRSDTERVCPTCHGKGWVPIHNQPGVAE